MSISYRPLNREKDEIRLLKLFPASESDRESEIGTEPIPCGHILHAYLPQNPSYVALSYVWGCPDKTSVIKVNFLKVHVTPNLYNAIIALRPLKKPFLIWIDAVCINQADNEEKSWQVELMKNIYEQATNVLAYLGPEEDSSDAVMDYLDLLGERAEAIGCAHGSEHLVERWTTLVPHGVRNANQQNLQESLSIGIGSCYDIEKVDNVFRSISGWYEQNDLLPLKGLLDFFSRAWWGRIWVLQEIAVPEKAEFVCGSRRITRCRLRAAYNACYALWRVLTIISVGGGSRGVARLTDYQRLLSLRIVQHRAQIMLSTRDVYVVQGFPLVALLRLTCVGTINPDRHGPHDLNSTDPRDKIFALLGLSSDKEELRRMGVYPDYAKGWTEIYTLTMVALLRQGYVSLLSYCQYRERQDALPSWVPNWSKSITDRLQDVRNDHVTIYPAFNAAGEDPQNSEVAFINKDGAIKGIGVKAFICDEISKAGSFPNRVSSIVVPLNETWTWPKEWLVEIVRLTYHTDGISVDFQGRLRTAARTAIGGVCYNDRAAFVRVGDARFEEAVILLRSTVKAMKDQRMRSEARRFFRQKKTQRIIEPNGKPKRLGMEIIGKSLGRLPFVTKKGRLVLSSERVVEGDCVALIKGCQVPLVLRRYGKSYRVISEAYVDGIMDGEVAETATFGRIRLF